MVRVTSQPSCSSYTCRWPRHKRVLPRLPFRPPASPRGVCTAFCRACAGSARCPGGVAPWAA